MKKIFTLLSFLMLGAMAFAQQYYVFADKDGNVIEDGATITRTEVEDDGFSVLLKSGLYLKNVDAPSNYTATVKANITRIDNGAVQLCFPTNCYSYDKVGTHGSDDKAALEQGKVKDLLSEWLPTAYGECIVEYTVQNYQGAFPKNKYTVTVKYKYAGATGIEQVKNSQSEGRCQYFDLMGHQSMSAQRGLNIVRSSDGSVRKYIRK
jgi:hypothetical protein